jgi:hypothetical protein
MPLPDADPPEKSRLYEELKSKTALPSATGAITPDLVDSLKNATFTDAENEDQLRRLVLLMQATGVGSMSGPLPGQQKIIETQVDNANTYVSVFSPGVGEVWQFQGFNSRGASGVSGTLSYELDFHNTVTNERLLLIDASSSSSSDFPLIESGQAYPVYLTYPFECRVRVEGTFTFSLLSTGFFRVR